MRDSARRRLGQADDSGKPKFKRPEIMRQFLSDELNRAELALHLNAVLVEGQVPLPQAPTIPHSMFEQSSGQSISRVIQSDSASVTL